MHIKIVIITLHYYLSLINFTGDVATTVQITLLYITVSHKLTNTEKLEKLYQRGISN